MCARPLVEMLGHPTDARLLIINADDFGMCQAENAATIAGLAQHAFCCASIMVPCPWFVDAAVYAQQRPSADLGVHLTHTSEWANYKWGPVTSCSLVPSMVDQRGHFHRDIESLYRHARLEEVEAESRAQIEAALAAGIDVTHLDSHMGTLQLDANYHALYVRLAADYALPIRMLAGRTMAEMGLAAVVDQADRLGVVRPDYLHVGGPSAPEQTAGYWTKVLQELGPGVSEIYVHAAFDTPEMKAVSESWRQRRADFDFFTASETRTLFRDLGITLIGYRALRELQRSLARC